MKYKRYIAIFDSFSIRSILLLVLLVHCAFSLGQLPTQNYVTTETLLDADGIRKVSSTQVYDGLGRPVMEVTDGLGTSGKKVYTMQGYNSNGEVERLWLPVVGNVYAQDVKPADVCNMAFSTYSDAKAYVVNTYDALGRKTVMQTAGEVWHDSGKAKTVEYGTNSENSVKLYVATGSPKYSLSQKGYYAEGTLFREKSMDEDGKYVETYKDLMGNKVLERRNGNNDTYFVYDAVMHLRFVLSPEYQKSGYKDKYAYEYRYDDRGNVVKKILPGCEYTQYWYDSADRLSFMQDATLRGHGLYRFYLYERYGRPAVQGVCSGCIRKPCLNVARMTPDKGLCGTGYDMAFPQNITDARIEVVNYYDNYDFQSLPEYASVGIHSMSKDNLPYPQGLQTGKVLTTNSGDKFMTVNYFNYTGHPSDIVNVLYGRRLTETHVDYSFTDKPTETKTNEYDISNGKKSLLISTVEEKEYSKVSDVLLSVTLTVNGKRQKVRKYEYDDLGRVKSVVMGGNAGSVSNEYDLHGWTTGIISKDFREDLHYADGIGTPCFNGNISSQIWSTSDYGQVRGYKFEYDGLDRLKEAVYGETLSLSDKQNRYNEKVVEYTANGAMKRFQRRGKKDDGEYGKIDNLNIKLDGNRLLNVTDDALPANKYSSFNFIDGADEQVEYEYNGVGALTKDLNRGITIKYDNLNNPRRIDFKDGNSITYTYLPDGTLLRKGYGEKLNQRKSSVKVPVSDSLATAPGQIIPADSMVMVVTGFIVWGNTEYSGNIIYRDGRLDKVLFPGGYCTFDKDRNDEPVFHYFTQDHLGNNRVVTNEDGTVEQITHYYPFGGTFNDAGLNAGLQQYKYNGKELDRIAGLNTYDYGARQYFPSLPVWDRMDALCEKDYHVSPYAYCRNNPMKFIDNDGKWGIKYIDINNKNINIVANIYCVSKSYNTVAQYTENDIKEINEYISNNFSKLGIVSEGKYKGYSLTTTFNFILGGDLFNTILEAENDIVDGARIGNYMLRSDSKADKIFTPKINSDGTNSTVGGFTDLNKGGILMNNEEDTNLNRTHEAFHLTGLKHPTGGGKDGIMHYPPMKVSQEEINKLSESSEYLYEIIK